ncbi:MAG: HIT family protein [Gammaproteobacteria bacterium]
MSEDLKANMNPTMLKFGAPATVLQGYNHWLVQLRPAQATLGSLVLIARAAARAFPELSRDAFTELARVTKDIEAVLTGKFGYEKLNYLMLMMVDPDVHFHVIPRYAAPKQFSGVVFTDPGWPGPPDLGHDNKVDSSVLTRLTDELKSAWQDRI